MTWQPIPTVTAPHYLDTNLNQVQKCVNWFLQNVKDGYVLRSVPGYQLTDTVANNAACRGAMAWQYGQAVARIFSVNGNTVYMLTDAGAAGALAPPITSSSYGDIVVFAMGLSYAMFVDRNVGYTINYNSLTITQITDVNFPPLPNKIPVSCACFNGQFIVVDGYSDRWYMSAVDDPLTWTPIISGRALTNGDTLYHVEVIKDIVYFFGGSTIEPWYPSTIDPYLQPVTGAVMPVGIVHQRMVTKLGDRIFLHGYDQNGRGSFWMISGTQITKIATPYIDEKIGDWVISRTNSRVYSYANAGQEFFEAINDSASSFGRWIYNITSQTWSETTSDRALQVVISCGHDGGRQNTASGNAPIALSSANGKIFALGTNAAPYNQFDSGNQISRVLDFELDGGTSRIFNFGLRFDFEIQHDSSSTFTFSALLQKSDDGGRTFDTGITLTKAITNGTSAQAMLLQTPPTGSVQSGRIYRLTIDAIAARLILRRAEGLVRVGRF